MPWGVRVDPGAVLATLFTRPAASCSIRNLEGGKPLVGFSMVSTTRDRANRGVLAVRLPAMSSAFESDHQVTCERYDFRCGRCQDHGVYKTISVNLNRYEPA